MPVISIFYGITISLYFLDNRRHHSPHIHAKFQDDEAVVSIPDGELLEGFLPPGKMKMVIAWVEIHQENLMADWELAVNGQQPFILRAARNESGERSGVSPPVPRFCTGNLTHAARQMSHS